jgi:hypothetical protein
LNAKGFLIQRTPKELGDDEPMRRLTAGLLRASGAR